MSSNTVGELPPSWSKSKLSGLADLIRGVSYKKEDASTSPSAGAVPLLRATNITGSALTFDALVYVPKHYVSSDQVLRSGDIVIASSSGSKDIVGKAGQLLAETDSLSFGAFCTAIRPATEVHHRYIGYYFESPAYRGAISDISAGSNINNIKSSELAAHIVPVAPAAEQVRIVEKLEELLSDLDAGVAELKAAQRKLAQYRQSLLKAVVEGALTADWRTANGAPQETGAELLQRILSERRARWEEKQLAKFASQGKAPPKGWQAKYPEPVVADLTDLPVLPEGWVWATVDQCAIDEDGITDGPFGSNLKSEHYTESGPRVIRLQNIGDGRFQDARAYISEEHYESLKKHAVIEGDVVVAMLGEVLPRSCAIPAGVAPAIVKADCARVRLNQKLVSTALAVAVLNSEPTRKRVNGLVKGIGRPRVNLGHIRSIPVPVPPRPEQERILDVLSESLESCDTESSAIERGFSLSAAQRRALLKAAFAGQLVPQDPKDEPASALLARIHVERAKQVKQSKVRKTKQHKEIAAVLSQLIDVLAEAGDWMPAQEVFHRCGVAEGAQTDQIEALYAELRALDKAGRLAIKSVNDDQGRKLFDKLKLISG